MNSKKKNKNKQNKPPNPTPPQKEEITDPVTPVEVIESVVEDRVPNIVSENVPDVKQSQTSEDTPKKPKRNRGKKNKDDEKSDKENDVKIEEPIPVMPSQTVEDALIDVNIAPTARKKKNKNKKNQDPNLGEKLEEKEVQSDVKLETSDTKSQEVPIQKVEESEPETKSSKKKNKKKKNRNDSERSEKEEISCTSAFQQLLVEEEKIKGKTENATKSTKDQSNVHEIKGVQQMIIPAEVKPEEEAIPKDEGHKNKKKNKKDKKHTPVDQPTLSEDIATRELLKTDETALSSNKAELPSQVITKDIIEPIKIEKSVPDSSDVEEISPKQKAKIAKPVEKKKKGKSDCGRNIEEKPECVEESKASETESLPVIVSANDKDFHVVDSAKTVLQADVSPKRHEEVNPVDTAAAIIGCENKDEKHVLLQPDDNTETRNKRKKSHKPSQGKEMPSTLETPRETVSQTNKCEESKAVKDSVSLAEETKSKVELPCEVESEVTSKQIPTTDVKSEQLKAPLQTENKSKGKKSPKPQRKNDTVSSEVITTLAPKPEMKQEPETEGVEMYKHNLSIETSSTAKEEVKPEELPVQLPVTNIGEEAKKDETERIPTPDHEKRQKRKKSPKPPIDIEKASGSKGKSNHGSINIDDIIIIQAEVVSEEKVQKGDTFIASGENIQVQDDSQQAEVKPDHEKSKKGKKSPKTIKKDLFPEFKTIELTEVKDVHVDIQTPMTPKPADFKPLPDTIPLEVEVPKAERMPSPSDITPDLIEYPRCSSEQLLDSNNNTVIQEISNVESKLGIPIDIPDTPFIKHTELLTPEVSGMKVTQAESVIKNIDEKTDLKSKVMEVNQDMEELRLSIERSLAELTSLDKTDAENEKKMQEDSKKNAEQAKKETAPAVPIIQQIPDLLKTEEVPCETKKDLSEDIITQEPVCPERKDRKGKGKSKKKGKQETVQSPASESSTTTTTIIETKEPTQAKDDKQDDKKSDQKSEKTQEKGKQQCSGTKECKDNEPSSHTEGNTFSDFEPIENFEDAMTSSIDDVNKTFEIIANETNPRLDMSQNNPEINVIAPEEDKGGRQEKQNPVSPPKNLLGHPDIPVPSSRTDYKKEKNKTPNYRQAKVKIKDLSDDQTPEKTKESKESQTESRKKNINLKKSNESICVTNKNEDYVYKYSFRKVFLQCACHVCKKDLNQSRVPCSCCNLIFYCNQKHKDEDYSQHQALCFAVSTICHLKDQKFVYADALNITGHNYRLLRMQTIVSCEKVLKRRLAAWEQEALLYPRLCARAACREWRQGKLADCDGCGQISYCSEHPDHLPSTHARWCKSYNLYRSLVCHQQTQGRLEPKLPTRVVDLNPMPDNINEVLANMYEERIDMSDIEYAALTQLATAPLTALHCLQAYKRTANGVTKKSTLTIHIVGAELQFEADVLNKWEVFLLHLVPQVNELRVVLIGPDLNPSNLPLELLGKIKLDLDIFHTIRMANERVGHLMERYHHCVFNLEGLCNSCRQNNRRVVFDFQDKKTYHEFWASDNFTTPDLVCAFNPSIQRSSTYNGKDSWPTTITCILKLRVPFAITSHTLSELSSDLARVRDCSDHSIISHPKNNSFASVRPDRNFISDDEAPLLFKNQCVAVVCGV